MRLIGFLDRRRSLISAKSKQPLHVPDAKLKPRNFTSDGVAQGSNVARRFLKIRKSCLDDPKGGRDTEGVTAPGSKKEREKQ